MATYQSTHTGAEIDEAVDAVDEKLPKTGGTISGNLDVTGNIVTGGQIQMPNNTGLYTEDSNGSYKNSFYLTNTNNLHIGFGTAPAGYGTYINGYVVALRYGTSRTIGFMLSANGNVGIGVVTPTVKLDVDGDVAISGSLSLGGQAVVSVFSGSTAPSSSTGSNGDIYIQTS